MLNKSLHLLWFITSHLGKKKYPEEVKIWQTQLVSAPTEEKLGLFDTQQPTYWVKNSLVWLTRQTGTFRVYYLSGVCSTSRQRRCTLTHVHGKRARRTDKGRAEGTNRILLLSPHTFLNIFMENQQMRPKVEFFQKQI